jgi:serine/threonine-protein kinase HipA
MARKKTHTPLNVLMNGRLVGRLEKAASGATSFQYAASWLAWEHRFAVSLSLPLVPTAYRGAEVAAVFDNLLPDRDAVRRRVAERMGAQGIDFYSLLEAIGRDCVGAMQFLPEGQGANEPGIKAKRSATWMSKRCWPTCRRRRSGSIEIRSFGFR